MYFRNAFEVLLHGELIFYKRRVRLKLQASMIKSTSFSLFFKKTKYVPKCVVILCRNAKSHHFTSFQTYYISKARVSMAKKQFSNVNNDYELVFDQNTEIEEVC